jgi:pimeloyl-ACP methyl ester carboxylesterase
LPRAAAPASDVLQQGGGFGARRIAAGDHSIFFRCALTSAAQSPAVALVHGLGLSGRYMLPTALGAAFSGVRTGSAGVGDSSKPAKALDVPALAEAVAAWIRAMELAPAALLGNSFGCQVMADLGARHLDLVERAVLQARPRRPRSGRGPSSSCAGVRTSGSIRIRWPRSRGATTASAATGACCRPSGIS